MNDKERKHLLQSFSAWLAMDEYLEDMRLRNCASRTIKEYKKVLVNYFLDTNDYNLDVSRQTLRSWVSRMYERGLEPATISTQSGVLRSFLRFAFNEGLSTEDTSRHLPKIKLGKQLPKSMTLAEVGTFMDAVRSNGDRGKRDLVIFMLMYTCGLRVSEVVTLRVKNVDFQTNFIHVSGKGNKERRIFLKADMVKLLKTWLSGKSGKWVFPGQGDGHLSSRVVQHYTNQYGKQIGLHIHSHMFRHSCATHYLMAGAPITFVQRLLGHAKLSTTGIYTQLTDLECAKITQEISLAGV